MENDALADKITALLSDPKGMEKIKSVADSLLGGENETAKAESSGELPDISAIMKMMKTMNLGKSDSRTELLMALKPHLSSERQERVDKAVKLLRLVPLLPLMKDMI